MKFLLLGLLLVSSVYADINAGLLAHYPLNGNLQDRLGGADAVNVGGTLVEDRFGNADSAYRLKAFPSTIEVPHDTLQGQVDYSLSIWVKSEIFEFAKCLWSFSNTQTNGYYYMFLVNRVLGIASAKNNWSHREYSKSDIFTGNWQHVVMSRDSANSQYHVYVDGQWFYTVDSTQIEDQQPLSIDGFVLGQIQSYQVKGGYNQFWQYEGALSDLRLYSRSFSQADADELYQAELTGNGGQPEPTDAQTCVDYLQILAPGTITEDLTFPLNTDENEYYHHYVINFNDFTFDGTCFDSQVWIGNNIIEHTVENNQIIITFPWKDSGDWGCDIQSPTLQQCNFQVHIYWDSVLQHKKLFTSTITTPDLENLSQELNLNVVNDEDESLKEFDQTLDTQLKFCADIQCSSYTNPSEIIRNTDVYVEFKVNTAGYNQYFPVHSRLTLNEFNVEIQNQAAIDSWAEQGRIIYHFRPPFASSSITLAIGISLSKTNPNNRLRILQEAQNGLFEDALEDEKSNVGKYIRINVVEPEEENGNKKVEEDDGDNTGLIIGIVAGVVVLVVSLVGIGVFYKLKTKGNNYKETNSDSQKSDELKQKNTEQVDLQVQ